MKFPITLTIENREIIFELFLTDISNIKEIINGFNSLSISQRKEIARILESMRLQEIDLYNKENVPNPYKEMVTIDWVRNRREVIINFGEELWKLNIRENATDKGDMAGFGW